jgi:hypothetical protein
MVEEGRLSGDFTKVPMDGVEPEEVAMEKQPVDMIDAVLGVVVG